MIGVIVVDHPQEWIINCKTSLKTLELTHVYLKKDSFTYKILYFQSE